MEILKIICVAITSTVLITYLKNVNSDITLILTICVGIILLIFILNYVTNFLTFFINISSLAKIDNNLISLIIKIVAISYLIQTSINLIEDFGLKSIADKLAFGGKIIIFSMSLPILQNLLEVVTKLL